MKLKTQISAEDGKQELTITRVFDLPVALLFKAHTEPELVTQWMGNRILKWEAKKHGSWQFETADPQGNVMFRANGVFHEFVLSEKITRTFEIENTPFDVQLEFFEFEKITDETSKLTMHIVYRSIALRDQMLQMPFAAGLNMAHNRLQDIVSKLK